MLRRLPVVYALLIAGAFAYLSWVYATHPPAPTDPLSVWLGWGALGAMVIMLVYSLARRSKALRELARLSYWLHFHIFCGVLGVMMGVFHSMHIFTREAPVHLLNPGVLNLAACVVAFSSGIFGRYLYGRVPRTSGGEAQKASNEQEHLAHKIFRRWIIMHRPIAGIMYVLSVVHVVLSYMFTPSM